jgi:hypothetical protein
VCVYWGVELLRAMWGKKGRITPNSGFAVLVALVISFLFIVSGGAGLAGKGTTQTTATQTSTDLTPATLQLLSDGGSISATVGGIVSVLSDRITPQSGSPQERAYLITLTTAHPDSSMKVELTTTPVAEWAKAGQFPDGPAALPSLSHWQWSVTVSGRNDTSNWAPNSNMLERTISWQNSSYVVTGIPVFTVPVSVDAAVNTTVKATGAGFVQQGQLTTNYDQTLNLAQAVNPSFVRWSQLYDAPATWSASKGSATFDLSQFAPIWNFTKALGATPILSVPAGTWGDGNTLPSGMPLNTSLLVNWYGHSTGYFPTAAAYGTYLKNLAQDLKNHGWTVTYWNIGNEVPIWISMSYAEAFAVVFNAGAKAIHSIFPTALVGSDVLTAPGRISYFASALVGVGFLGFHFYPAGHLCAGGTTFCMPNNVNGYLTDSSIISASMGYPHSWQFLSPEPSRSEWFNITGHWLPIVDDETNLNSAQAQGSDPRQQTLFDAAWLEASYITASADSVKGVVSYSLLSAPMTPNSPTKPFGGWGFGLAVEPTATTTIEYAPYWATELWGTSIPAGALELKTTTANSYFLPSAAVYNGNKLEVVVVNLADVNATVPITVTGASYAATSVQVLDQHSYDMVYDGLTKSERLLKSGITEKSVSGGSKYSVTIDGYGVAVVTFTPKAGLPTELSTGSQPVGGYSPQTNGAGGIWSTASFPLPHAATTTGGLEGTTPVLALGLIALPRWSRRATEQLP